MTRPPNPSRAAAVGGLIAAIVGAATRAETSAGTNQLECVTQDPREPAGPDYLAVCTKVGTEISDSIHCPPECGGHPVCVPCLDLAILKGLVRWSRSSS